MKFNYVLLSLCFIASCNSKPDIEEVSKLNGFWEIQKAETPYQEQTYTMNQMVDYIHIEDSTGFRKKVQPNYLGNYKTSKDREYFSVRDDGDRLVLEYRNDYDTWTETLLDIEDDQFVVKNDQNFIYTYKRHEPQTIDFEKE